MHVAIPALALLAHIALSAVASAQSAPRQLDLAALVARGLASGGAAANDAPDGGCTPDWAPTFGPAAGTDGIVYRGMAFDDGTGPALYAAGEAPQGMSAPSLAR